MDTERAFAKRLREAMTIRGMKQVELCEQTGIPKSAMSQYLNGAFEPKQNRLWDIANALNVSESWLMGYDVAMDREPDTDTDPLAGELFACYGEVKEHFDESDLEDIKLFMRMKAERKRKKELEGK